MCSITIADTMNLINFEIILLNSIDFYSKNPLLASIISYLPLFIYFNYAYTKNHTFLLKKTKNKRDKDIQHTSHTIFSFCTKHTKPLLITRLVSRRATVRLNESTRDAFNLYQRQKSITENSAICKKETEDCQPSIDFIRIVRQ